MRRLGLGLLTVVVLMGLMVALLKARTWMFGPLHCEDGVAIPPAAAHNFCAIHGGDVGAVARSLGVMALGLIALAALGFAWRRLRRR